MVAEDKYAAIDDLIDDYAKWLEERGYKRPDPWRNPDQHDEYVAGRAALVWPWPEELHIDSFIGTKAIEALKDAAKSGKPFCHWISFNSPHPPIDPPQRFLDMYGSRELPAAIRRPYEPFDKPASRIWIGTLLERWLDINCDVFAMKDEDIKERRKYYYATITLVDYWIGKIIKELQESGLYDNTIIVFTSDHGDAQGDHNLIEKSFFHEGMVRVPMIIHYPRSFEPGVSNEFVQSTDIAPTLLSLAGLRIPEGMDGQDMSPLVKRTDGWKSRDAVFSENYPLGRPITMVRTREWKLVYEDEPTCCELYDMGSPADELYNVYNEPKHRKIREELTARIKAWRSAGEPLFDAGSLLRTEDLSVRKIAET